MPNDAPRVPYSYQSGDGQRRRDRRTMIVPEFDVDLNWHRPDPDASTMGLPPATIWAFRFFGSLVGLGLGLLLIFNAIRGWHAP